MLLLLLLLMMLMRTMEQSILAQLLPVSRCPNLVSNDSPVDYYNAQPMKKKEKKKKR